MKARDDGPARDPAGTSRKLRQEYVFRCYKQVQVAGRLSRVVRPALQPAGRQAEGVTVRNATCSVILLVSLTAPVFADETKSEVPLFDDLGNHSQESKPKPRPPTLLRPGPMFMFAYNHNEAVRAPTGRRPDPGCAMAYWGVALASGMNYNDPSFTTPGRAHRPMTRCSAWFGGASAQCTSLDC